jgi:uncharacterized protein YdeI (YjbR/CyaY-like superfamily)
LRIIRNSKYGGAIASGAPAEQYGRVEPTYFADAAAFRRWLEAHHARAAELLVGFRKKSTGRPSIDWPQARDEALCFGWIDGVRRSLDDDSYTIRFTPRRPGSVWSRVNLARFEALKAAGRMTPAGERAHAEGKERTDHYSYEKAPRRLAPAEEKLFRTNKAAWVDWEKRPPGYRRMALHWITSAKKPETRARRLASLIEDSAAGRKIAAVDIGRKRG